MWTIKATIISLWRTPTINRALFAGLWAFLAVLLEHKGVIDGPALAGALFVGLSAMKTVLGEYVKGRRS